MKNLYLLPTEKPSRLVKFKDETNLLLSSLPSIKGQGYNIYILSDDVINNSDWCILDQPLENSFPNLQEVFKNKEDSEFLNQINHLVKKIILTTDPDLIADGVQAIDENFLKKFVENPNIVISKNF